MAAEFAPDSGDDTGLEAAIVAYLRRHAVLGGLHHEYRWAA